MILVLSLTCVSKTVSLTVRNICIILLYKMPSKCFKSFFCTKSVRNIRIVLLYKVLSKHLYHYSVQGPFETFLSLFYTKSAWNIFRQHKYLASYGFHFFSRYLSPLQADPSKPVMVPGDPERNHMKLVEEEGGVRYHENQLKASVSDTKHTRLELYRLRNASYK